MDNTGKEQAQTPAGAESQPRLVPRGVAWSMTAGLAGLFIGGAVVAFTAAVAAPAIRDAIRKRRDAKKVSATVEGPQSLPPAGS